MKSIFKIILLCISIILCVCCDMKENSKIKSALCEYFERDSTIVFVSDEDTIRLAREGNYYNFEFCNGGPLSACYRLAFYELTVLYSGDGWNINYYIHYEESYHAFQTGAGLFNDSTNISLYYDARPDDIHSELTDELFITEELKKTPNGSHAKIYKGVGLTEFKANGKIYRRVQ